jgi:DGQHR domain-containing protein
MQRRYDGYFVRQRNDQASPECFAFYADASEVLSWAAIKRIADSPDGIQRLLRVSRVKAISRFFGSSPINVIPNNVLVAFDINAVECVRGDGATQSEKVCAGHITFDDDNAGVTLVDGQHRLFGMAQYEQEALPVLVVALLNADTLEQAFQFVVVNNKAVKVPTTNVKSIIAEHLDEEILIERLMGAGVNYGKHSPILKEVNDLESSPFKGLLDWDFNRADQKLVSVTAIEQSLKYLRDTFTQLRDDEDSTLEIFCAIWRAVKNVYPNAWGRDDSYLMKKVSINAVHQSLVDRLKVAYEMGIVDIFSANKVMEMVSAIVSQIPEALWLEQWSIKVQDNANVREIIMHDVGQVLQNVKSPGMDWRTDLKLVASE